MRPSRLIVAILLALVGLLWVGQGTGVLGGSAMSGSVFWALVGIVLLVVALVIVVRERSLVPRG